MRNLAALICTALALPAEALPVERCINLGNALEAPTEGEWGYVIQRDHITSVAKAGFDTVRLPVKFSGRWNGERIDPALLARVDEVIGWAREDGLQIILDLHHFDELMQAPGAYADDFFAIWQDIAAHYRDAPNDLIFELLNEPSYELTTEGAVALFDRVVPMIRSIHPERWIILGGGRWSAATEMAGLPVYDERTAHTFHFYLPFEFTHQQAHFIDQPPPPRGWGTAQDRAETATELARGLSHDSAPVLLGEFGVYEAAPEQDAIDWLAFVARAADSAGVGWCVWSIAPPFAILETESGTWRDGRLGALMSER